MGYEDGMRREEVSSVALVRKSEGEIILSPKKNKVVGIRGRRNPRFTQTAREGWATLKYFDMRRWIDGLMPG